MVNSQIISMSDMAIEILQKTQDGDNLAPRDLSLLEAAVNEALNENGIKAFHELYQKVLSGYTKPWFYDVENFTQDHEGYVYYKGVQVEHYDPMSYNEGRKHLLELETRCLILEASGIKPTSKSAIWNWSDLA